MNLNHYIQMEEEKQLNKSCETNTNSNDVDNSKGENFFLDKVVRKGFTTIRQRIDQRLDELGKKWADVYNTLGMNKVDACNIRNGYIIPPKWKRIQIAEALGIDSTIIWDTPILLSADKIKEELTVVKQSSVSPNNSELNEDDKNGSN